MPSFLRASPKSNSQKSAMNQMLVLALVSAMVVSGSVVGADAKFLLSCRVISGICQGDGRCLDEMSQRFPDCYLESPFDLLPAKAAEVLLTAPEPLVETEEAERLAKRAPALKLMKVLMMKDRIPVGRR